MNWKIMLFKQHGDAKDIEAVKKVIDRSSFWAAGPEVTAFEQKVASYARRRYALAFNSGTSALHSVLLAYGVKGGEVIVPSFTFVATASAIVLAGGRPVFAEVEEQSFGLDPEDVKERITEKTKAILPVHYGGAPCKEIKALQEIAADRKLLLIEDAAESFGASVGREKVGSFGNAAMFSFCQSKAISTGEGGAVVTDDAEICDRMKLIGSHGRLEQGRDYFSTIDNMPYVQIGYNFRMPSMVAALGISQLAKMDKLIEMRRRNAAYLTKRLSPIDGLQPPVEIKGHRHIYQMYTVKLPEKKRDALQQHLTAKGIMSKVYFEPVHLMKIYREMFNCREGDLPRTEGLSKRVLTLPLYAGMRREELQYVINSIKGFLGK